jgi:hypothetical protein
VIHREGDSAFIVLGDPGEQDASQFVIVPALRDEAAVDGADERMFMVICSDVIYPSGDINDYVDSFYVPYGQIPNLPVYALPGNHDWYDGLSGFMWHFCRRDALATTVYGIPEGRSIVESVLGCCGGGRPSGNRSSDSTVTATGASAKSRGSARRTSRSIPRTCVSCASTRASPAGSTRAKPSGWFACRRRPTGQRCC